MLLYWWHNMLELTNESNWVAGIYEDWDSKREPQLTIVFKASFEFDLKGNLQPLPEDDLIESDQHVGDPQATGLLEVSEIAPYKQGSEFYLYGTARPERENMTAMEVGVGIFFNKKSQWKKVLRIFGERKWKKTMVNYIHDEPGFVEEIPLSYEHAFGGTNPDNVDDVYEANPVGMGYNSDQRNLLSDQLPRIELGSNFMMTPMQKLIPAGFAPLPVFWEPRVSDTGALNEDPEAQGGCPYTKEAKACLHNVAPLDQRFSTPFTGGEVLHLRALVAEVDHKKTVQIVLPELHPQLYTIINDEVETLSPVCDTLIVDTDQKTLSMIYRVGIPWPVDNPQTGWVVLKDLDSVELPYDKEGRDAPRMASN